MVAEEQSSARVLSVDLAAEALEHEPLPRDDVTQGVPTTAAHPLDALGGVEIGIWEMTEGGARDTEADEVFVVLSGSATVHFEDGVEVELSAGSAVRLRAGEHTEWIVRETLRKVYITAE